MTEREKRIEKMARDMCNRKMTCEECIGVHGDIYFRDKSDCKYCFAATRAYNAGYRKADEVRKETAKEFIELFHKYVIISEDTFDGTVKMNITDAVKMNEEIEKKFGVEVEE